MRKMVEPQMPLVQRVLDEAPAALEAVFKCLVRSGGNPKRGREGLGAEQVVRILVVKQLEIFSKFSSQKANVSIFAALRPLWPSPSPSP